MNPPLPPPVPNFRVPSRLISWMQINNVRQRLPQSENVFFKEKLSVDFRACGLVNYAMLVTHITPEMESVICKVPIACLEYASLLKRTGRDVPQEIVDSCCVDQAWVVKMAGVLGTRIEHFEHKIVSPEWYVDYCTAARGRVPELEDRILFSNYLNNVKERASAALKLIERLAGHGYGSVKNEILNDQKLKDLIKQDVSVVASFMEFFTRRGGKLPSEFHGVFAGDGMRLFKLAEHLRSRLPVELEMTWQGAKSELVQYAFRWVRGPLPEGLEDVLIGDIKAITDYAFQVIRGFASPRLGDTLHNCLLIGEQTEEVQRYIAECDRIERWKSLIEQGIAAAG